jgi:hypothetical protein
MIGPCPRLATPNSLFNACPKSLVWIVFMGRETFGPQVLVYRLSRPYQICLRHLCFMTETHDSAGESTTALDVHFYKANHHQD